MDKSQECALKRVPRVNNKVSCTQKKKKCLYHNVLKKSWAGIEGYLPKLLGGINMKKMHGGMVRSFGVRDISNWTLT